jgi:hypothetical protein
MPVCKTCGREIIFKKNFITGNVGVVEKIRSVYEQSSDGLFLVPIDHEGPLYISHFVTCPDANLYSKKSKEK